MRICVAGVWTLAYFNCVTLLFYGEFRNGKEESKEKGGKKESRQEDKEESKKEGSRGGT